MSQIFYVLFHLRLTQCFKGATIITLIVYLCENLWPIISMKSESFWRRLGKELEVDETSSFWKEVLGWVVCLRLHSLCTIRIPTQISLTPKFLFQRPRKQKGANKYKVTRLKDRVRRIFPLSQTSVMDLQQEWDLGQTFLDHFTKVPWVQHRVMTEYFNCSKRFQSIYQASKILM